MLGLLVYFDQIILNSSTSLKHSLIRSNTVEVGVKQINTDQTLCYFFGSLCLSFDVLIVRHHNFHVGHHHLVFLFLLSTSQFAIKINK